MLSTLTVDQILSMPQEQLLEAYRQGYRLEELAYPGVYPDENKIIPYSPRRKFGFASPTIESAQPGGISISTDALLVWLGFIGLILYLRSKEKV